MTTVEAPAPETRAFEADVAKLLHLMVHSVYSDKDIFLRELISNAADACEKLRYEAIAEPALLGDDPQPRDHARPSMPTQRRLTVEDNGIGMSRDEMVEALGTIARSGTKAFMDRIAASKGDEGTQLIGQFGVGFYSAFMVADHVDVISRRAGSGRGRALVLGRQGHLYGQRRRRRRGARARHARRAPSDGGREDLYRALHAGAPRQGAVRSRAGADRDRREAGRRAAARSPTAQRCGPSRSPRSARTTTPTSTAAVAGQFDEPALTIHYRAEGRHEYSVLAFVPGTQAVRPVRSRPARPHQALRRRVFITDEAELLPRYLRFVRGLVNSADLPLNVSREMIQESPILAAIKKGVANRVLSELEKLADRRRRGLRKDLGELRRGPEGRSLRRFRAPRAAARPRALQHHGVGRARGAR